MVDQQSKSDSPEFDGGECPVKKHIDAEGEPHMYVPRCPGGGINLNLFKMGFYDQCYSCGESEESAKRSGVKYQQWQHCAATAGFYEEIAFMTPVPKELTDLLFGVKVR